MRTLVRRELRARFKGSALGLFWSLIYPLAMVAVYTLVFSVLWRVTGNIPHYPLFVLSGLAVWGFFQAGIQLGTTSLVSNGELIKKVWFPRELVPASAVLAQTVTIGVMLGILIPVALDRRAGERPDGGARDPDRRRPDLPRARACRGCSRSRTSSSATSSICSRSRSSPGSSSRPSSTGSTSSAPPSSHRWLIVVMRYGNPVTPYVESVRAVVLQHVVPGAPLLVYTFVVGPLVALLGLWVMQRYEDRLAIEL